MSNMISEKFLLQLAGALLLVSPFAVTARQQKPQAATPAAQQPAPDTKKIAPATKAATDKNASPATTRTAAIAADGKDGKPPWNLKVTRKAPASITLSAKNGSLSEIASEISRRLKVPVILTPLMQRQRISQEFEALPVEGALRLLAPQVYIDYELSGDAAAMPKIVGIYLQGLNEQPPADAAVVKGGSEALLIEGNTEDRIEVADEKEAEKQPLRVTFEKNQISVHARKQPLTAVLYEIASKVDIPFEMKYESTELVDLDFSSYTMEQAVRTISPNIRLYQRTNLSNYEVRPLRLVLVSPANNQQTTKI
jgi:hypothetical protein